MKKDINTQHYPKNMRYPYNSKKSTTCKEGWYFKDNKKKDNKKQKKISRKINNVVESDSHKKILSAESVGEMDNIAYAKSDGAETEMSAESVGEMDNIAYTKPDGAETEMSAELVEEMDNIAYAKPDGAETEVSAELVEEMDNIAYAKSDGAETEMSAESVGEMDDVAYTKSDVAETKSSAELVGKMNNISDMDDKGRSQQDKKRKAKKTISLDDEFNPYTFAKRILNKYRIWHLDPSDWTLWIWNGSFYEPLNDNKLEALIYSELPEEFKSSFKSCKKSLQATAEFIKRECAPNPIQSKKSGKSYKTFKKKDMKKVYNRVVLENGVYDVMTGELLEPAQKLPYYYGINAKYVSNESLDTPYFDKLLKDATGNDEDTIQMIHWALGMLLLPNKCKKFIVAGNASNSGKSILFGRFLDSLFDAKRISRVDSSKLGGRFALGNCEDKLLVSCLDIDENVLTNKAVGVIKRATGEEKISAEAKYKDGKEIIVRFKFVFATNLGFTSKRYDPGLVNRILALPFIKEIEEENQIANLAEKLQKEKDYIVAKILREMKDVIGTDGNIVIPESDLSKQMKASWTTVNSFFDEFCEEKVKVTGNKANYISWEELYEFYCQYFSQKSKASNKRYEILPKQAFNKSFIAKFEIGNDERVKQIRSRKFGEEVYPNAVRRLTGIKVKI